MNNLWCHVRKEIRVGRGCGTVQLYYLMVLQFKLVVLTLYLLYRNLMAMIGHSFELIDLTAEWWKIDCFLESDDITHFHGTILVVSVANGLLPSSVVRWMLSSCECRGSFVIKKDMRCGFGIELSAIKSQTFSEAFWSPCQTLIAKRIKLKTTLENAYLHSIRN